MENNKKIIRIPEKPEKQILLSSDEIIKVSDNLHIFKSVDYFALPLEVMKPYIYVTTDKGRATNLFSNYNFYITFAHLQKNSGVLFKAFSINGLTLSDFMRDNYENFRKKVNTEELEKFLYDLEKPHITKCIFSSLKGLVYVKSTNYEYEDNTKLFDLSDDGIVKRFEENDFSYHIFSHISRHEKNNSHSIEHIDSFSLLRERLYSKEHACLINFNEKGIEIIYFKVFFERKDSYTLTGSKHLVTNETILDFIIERYLNI